MDAWQEGLGDVTGEQVRVALAGVLTAHPEWPPTLGQFLALCKPVVQPSHRLFLPSPQIDASKRGPVPAQFAEAVAKLQEPQKDYRKWARDIMTEAVAGRYRLICGIEMAKRAVAAP
jgi:hypothetical protein